MERKKFIDLSSARLGCVRLQIHRVCSDLAAAQASLLTALFCPLFVIICSIYPLCQDDIKDWNETNPGRLCRTLLPCYSNSRSNACVVYWKQSGVQSVWIK